MVDARTSQTHGVLAHAFLTKVDVRRLPLTLELLAKEPSTSHAMSARRCKTPLPPYAHLLAILRGGHRPQKCKYEVARKEALQPAWRSAALNCSLAQKMENKQIAPVNYFDACSICGVTCSRYALVTSFARYDGELARSSSEAISSGCTPHQHVEIFGRGAV